MRERVDRIFHGTDYESVPVDEWLDGEVDKDEQQLMILTREIIGRDILRGLEVTAQDTLMISQVSAYGRLIMERFVYLDTEDDYEEAIDCFALNMYDGTVDTLYPKNLPNAIRNFEQRIGIIEDL